MKKSMPLLRIFVRAVTLVALHVVLLNVLAKVRLLEHLLAPGSQSYWAIAVTVAFLLLRTFLYIVGPGWLVCCIWLWYSKANITDDSRA